MERLPVIAELPPIRDDRPARRPRRRLFELSLLALAATTIAIVLALRQPIVDLRVERRDTTSVSLIHAGAVRVLPSDAPLTITRAAGPAMLLRADALVDGIAVRGDRVAKRAWWNQRGDIAAAFAAGKVIVRLPDGRTIVSAGRPRRFGDLNRNFWAALLTGFAGLLCGFWVFVMRPHSDAARTFAVMSVGLFGAGCTIAVGYDPLLLGERYRTLMLLNHASVQLFGAAILMLFCRFPLPLVPRRWLVVFPVAAAALTLVDVADLVRDTIAVAFASIAVEFVLFVLLMAGQAWAARRDPVGRAAMRLIGTSATISTALFVGVVVAPMLVSGAPLVNEASALPLLLVIYAGLGAAIVRTRLFAVDRWALSVMLSVCAAIGVIAVDLLILSLAAGSRGVILPLAIATVAIVYMPLRQAIVRRADRRRDVAARRSLLLAGDFAFAFDAEARAERWRATLAATFQPLEIALADDVADVPRLAERGVALRLPPVADTPAMTIRHAQGGSRDFDAFDVEQAIELVALVERLTGARDAYMRGVTEERERIAQDLHDDVSARLMTSLHREERGAMRDDVRAAMADIRTIVAGLVGRRRPLDDLIADLRHEAMARFEAHRVAMTWPLTPPCPHRRILDYAAYRHIVSIVRELVSNVLRHADAQHVAVEVSTAGERLTIVMRDDGRGIDPARPAGRGLANIAARAAQLGGAFAVRAGAPGTVARIDIPLGADLPESGYGPPSGDRLASR